MGCLHIPEMKYGEFSRRLHEKVSQQRVPLVGSLELTFRCNLRCQHCYLSGEHRGLPGQEELTREEICSLLDQIVDEGCLWFLITGGEPLLRKDFAEIYTYAKRKGLLVTLFTNGTLLTPRLANLLAEWRPFSIEISIYGRTQETYERVTGIPGSYQRCMRGIELLLERNLPLQLKTILMTLNQHELWEMKAFAQQLGVGFRYDPMINAGLKGERTPIQLRLQPEEVVAIDLEDPERIAAWMELYQRCTRSSLDANRLYQCGAGLYSFHIDPHGKLSVCLMSRFLEYNLRGGSFHEGWYDFLPRVRAQSVEGEYPCGKCLLMPVCGQCPGWADMEHGNPQEAVPFLCQIAHQRLRAFESLHHPERIFLSS